jgi:hypothetical protein
MNQKNYEFVKNDKLTNFVWENWQGQFETRLKKILMIVMELYRLKNN